MSIVTARGTAVTVLAPACNEAPVIERFVREVHARLEPGWELLVVDDGSSDGTGSILGRLSASLAGVRVASHATTRGMGAALATGFREAQGDVVVTMDADLSHPLELMPALVDGAQRADAVYASRYVAGGGMVGVPMQRRVISRGANALLRRLFGTEVRDLTTGMRAYRRSAVDVALAGLRGRSFETLLEITVRLVSAGCSIDEVPLVLRNRAAGSSKMRYGTLARVYAKALGPLLLVRWRRRLPTRAV